MKGNVVKVIEETHDTKTLRIVPANKISFIPGQFIMAGLDIEADGEKKLIKRAYSIASHPEKDYFEITFNLYPGGKLTPHLYKLKEGDEINIEGPFGKFNFKEDRKNAVLLGAGTGIAPLMSMVRFLANKSPKTCPTLIYSVKKPEDIIYKKELEQLEKSKKIRLFITITRPEGTKWNGITGRINKEMIEKYVENPHNSVFYICGSPDMAKTMSSILKDLGVSDDSIKKEQW